VKSKLLLGFALVLSGGLLMAFSTNAADTNSLRVVVIPSKTEVRIKEAFKVALRVENPTTTSQTVRVMSCSWEEEWKTSNTNVSWIGWACRKNSIMDVAIPPGGTYTNELAMLITGPISEKTLSFRMGFTPIGGTSTLWGNEVKLGILPPDKIDEQVETVRLPSGEILENHTYFDGSGMDGERFNKVFLKNPITGTSELIGDLNYEQRESLFTRFPHPREFVHGDEKTMVIGSIVCKRWQVPEYGRPYWYISSFDTAAGDAAEYLQSFYKRADPALATPPGEGPAWHLHYQFDDLDLENSVLTVKRVPWNAQTDFPEYRNGFPDYLVYSATGYNGRSGYEFPWKFDVVRTRGKNGQLWEKPMPFKMTLDYSVITFPITNGFMPRQSRESALAHVGAKEMASATLELSDQGRRSVECRYPLSGINQIVEEIEAMYGFACGQTNRFNIVWQPQDPAAWPVPSLNLDEWVLVGASDFGGDLGRNEFIRLRRIEP
jgi:hypothetical protein